MTAKSAYRPIYLEWHDSSATEGWQPLGELMKGSMLIRSIGWLVEEDEDDIAITTSLGEDCAMDVLWIPKAVIKKRRFIA